MIIDPLTSHLLKDVGSCGPVVLMYHSIGDDASLSRGLTVTRRNFSGHLELLEKYGWQTVCVRDLFANQPLPPRAIVITFDDGYADNFGAFELLANRNMCATWFIVSTNIGGTSGWVDAGTQPKLMLTKDQLREMSENGMEIGAHGRTHIRLTEVDQHALYDEVSGSKMDLEMMLGREVTSFAYPYGDYNSDVIEAVRAAGFHCACTVKPGRALLDNDPEQIRRITVFSDDSQSEFLRKIIFAGNDGSWPELIRYVASRMVAGFKKGTQK